MPLYDYKCPNGHITEVQHSISESPALYCEHVEEDEYNCQEYTCGLRLKRQIGGGDFVLKGAGFYSTDSPEGKLKRQKEAVDNL